MTERTLSQCRILVVEDEYLLADELCRELGLAGAVVVGPVGALGEALDLVAQEHDIDGAILDINLSGELVYPVAELLLTRGTPFIFTTGYDASAIPPRFSHITRCEKPVDMVKVTQAIGREV